MSQDLHAPVWIFVSVPMPLVGISYASRMFILALLPGGMRDRFRRYF